MCTVITLYFGNCFVVHSEHIIVTCEQSKVFPSLHNVYYYFKFWPEGLMLAGRTEDGFGMMFGVNHLGHFLLTLLLLDRLKASGQSRIINVSSKLHRMGSVDFNTLNTHKDVVTGQSLWHCFMAYCHSKLCNVLFTRELANRLEGSSVTCYSLHPG